MKENRGPHPDGIWKRLPALAAGLICFLWIAALGGSSAQSSSGAAAQHEVIGVKTTKANFKRTTHPDAQWFGEAGLGLFIHWGISSVHGGLDLSWGMMAGKFWGSSEERGVTLVTPEEYFKLAEQFKPDKFKPDEFLRVAKEAGFRYAVMTTKHHDGFTLWPSDAGDYGVKQHVPGADFVRDYLKACRALGLKAGLYYSPPDWRINSNYMSFHMENRDKTKPAHPLFNTRHEAVEKIPAAPEEHKAAYRACLRQQILELLTWYGKIDLIWFDGGPEVIGIDEIRKLQPGIVINPRMHGYGDFKTPEASVPKEPIEGWWELCDMWAGNWGYSRPHENYRTNGWMLERFTRVRGWGGNYLLNVGPRGDGTLPACYYDRMAEIKSWMKHSSIAVFDVSPGPFPERCNVPVTVRENTWYVMVPPTFRNPVKISTPAAPERVVLLRTGASVPAEFKESTLTIHIPASLRSDLVDVVAVEWMPAPAGAGD